MSSRTILGALAATAFVVAAAPALAAPVGGATYTGTYGNGAGPIQFRVSADGARLDSYRIADIAADTCRFLAQGDTGEWETPIARADFEYRLYDAILFRGTFGAGGVASGTFRLYNAAVPGVKPACDTGVVAWTAAVPGVAPPGGNPPGGGAPGGVPGSPEAPGKAPAARRAPTAARTSLARVRRVGRRISGRVRSAQAPCRRGRKIQLRRGPTTIARATSRPDGTYAFVLKRPRRGQTLRVRVTARTGTAPCTAATSASFKG